MCLLRKPDFAEEYFDDVGGLPLSQRACYACLIAFYKFELCHGYPLAGTEAILAIKVVC